MGIMVQGKRLIKNADVLKALTDGASVRGYELEKVGMDGGGRLVALAHNPVKDDYAIGVGLFIYNDELEWNIGNYFGTHEGACSDYEYMTLFDVWSKEWEAME